MSWPWIVNDPRGGRALEPLLVAVNRWRLPLLFFVSGAAATLSLRRRTWLQFAHERAQRLFLPLGVGVFLICPPQVWVERRVHGDPISWLELYRATLLPQPAGTAKWMHLWFVAYVLAFSTVGMPLLMAIRSAAGRRTIELAARACARWRPAIYLTVLPSFLVAALLGPRWPVTYTLVSDWANLCAGLVLFLWGFALASSSTWLDLVTARRRELSVAGGAVAAVFFASHATGIAGGWPRAVQVAFWSALDSAYAITWVLALVGWARVTFTRPRRWLTEANRAVYPFYILHETVTVLAVYLLLPWPGTYWLKLPLVVAATFLVSWAVYELVRRVPWLRPLLGLRSREPARGAAATLPA